MSQLESVSRAVEDAAEASQRAAKHPDDEDDRVRVDAGHRGEIGVVGHGADRLVERKRKRKRHTQDDHEQMPMIVSEHGVKSKGTEVDLFSLRRELEEGAGRHRRGTGRCSRRGEATPIDRIVIDVRLVPRRRNGRQSRARYTPAPAAPRRENSDHRPQAGATPLRLKLPGDDRPERDHLPVGEVGQAGGPEDQREANPEDATMIVASLRARWLRYAAETPLVRFGETVLAQAEQLGGRAVRRRSPRVNDSCSTGIVRSSEASRDPSRIT